MKTKSLYLSSLEENSGSLVIAIGLMEILKSKYTKVAFFRPIIKTDETKDTDILTIIKNFSLQIDYNSSYGFSINEVDKMIADNNIEHFYENILTKIKKLEAKYDFILIEGITKSLISKTVDFDINLNLAKNLQAPFISILNGKNKELVHIVEDIKIEAKSIKKSGCSHFGTFVNRIDNNLIDSCKKSFKNEKLSYELNFLPQQDELEHLTIEQIKSNISCKHIFGDKKFLEKTVGESKVACMKAEHFIEHVRPKDLIITSGDRIDIIMAIISLYHTKVYPNISAIILTGNLKLNNNVLKLLNSYHTLAIPIFTTKDDTYTTTTKINNIKPIITHKDKTKIATILGLFSKNVKISSIERKLLENSADTITPLMFEYNLFKRAREVKKTIVLPESFDDRVLKAAEISIKSNISNIILLGDKLSLQNKASSLGVDISQAIIIDPKTSKLTKDFAQQFYNIRKSKGLLEDEAYDIMLNDLSYFATMLVDNNIANGMVSGAVNTTANTVRPALQIIKTKPNSDVVSSVFLMCFDTKVLVYADCAINQDPTASQLASIAIDSSTTALNFGIEPKVAMLSYSTGTSGSGKDVDKVVEATSIIKTKQPKLKVEGPIQYDAAINKTIAKQKLPNSKVAGKATVFIFPDLNTGNNTYKAVRDASGAVAIGPILQGLNKPINDLSRGCIVEDIVNTIAITAIQANENKDN
ncbi:MAG: phosphate acetyltransferase [Campylobacterota bacterium]|nr:phosphate acetyltransferase [Campylobacterota bacterium]